MSPYLAGAVLLVLLFAVAAAFAWQERAGSRDGAVVYGVEEAIEFVWERLDEGARSRLKRAGVRGILEWEVDYLQRHPERAVFGGLEAAEYAQFRLHRSGHGYEGADIIAVLDLEAEYLAAIGAVAAPATSDEVAELERELDA